jgi:hypothetical protein
MLRSFGACFLLALIPLFGGAQQNELLPKLMESSSCVSTNEITKKLTVFISTLQNKRSKHSEQDFLRLVFRESHRKFFRNYQPYTQFTEIFESGNYDCLSATSFLSVVLNEFNYDYKIIETNYHIFLSVQTKQGVALIESTDRLSGIVTNSKQIDKRISTYRANALSINPSESGKLHYRYNLNLYQLVKPEQLPGLLYFNQAVIAFNNKNLKECAAKLHKANKIYESPRTAELALILVKSVVESTMSDDEKKELVKPFAKYLRSSNSVIASR